MILYEAEINSCLQATMICMYVCMYVPKGNLRSVWGQKRKSEKEETLLTGKKPILKTNMQL